MHLLLLVLLSGAQALFEDQAFKFDWKQSFIGHVTHAGFHTTARASVLVAATESHVLAGLDSDSGALLWRHAQEQDLVGAVRALHVGPKHAVSLSGEAPFLLLRIWDPVTGALVQEHLVRGGDSQPDLAGVTATRLVLLRWLDTGKLEITGHSFDSRRVAEAEVRQEKSPFPGAALAAGTADCLVTEELELACWHQSALHTLSLASPASAWARQDLGAPALGGLRASADGRLEVETEAGVARLEAGKVTLEKEAGLGVAMSGGCGGVAVRQACEQEGRGSAGGLYCRQHSRQLVVSSGAAGDTVVHTLAEDRGRVERAWAGAGLNI